MMTLDMSHCYWKAHDNFKQQGRILLLSPFSLSLASDPDESTVLADSRLLKLLYVSTAVDSLVLTDQPDSIYKSDAFYRHVDE